MASQEGTADTGGAAHSGFAGHCCRRVTRRETSANRYTRAAQRTGKPQIEELIDAARVPVFLLDEHQVVRPGEMGNVAQIRAAAALKGLDCQVVKLDSQFRCGGSDRRAARSSGASLPVAPVERRTRTPLPGLPGPWSVRTSQTPSLTRWWNG
jgi:hypothetical protein